MSLSQKNSSSHSKTFYNFNFLLNSKQMLRIKEMKKPLFRSVERDSKKNNKFPLISKISSDYSINSENYKENEVIIIY